MAEIKMKKTASGVEFTVYSSTGEPVLNGTKATESEVLDYLSCLFASVRDGFSHIVTE